MLLQVMQALISDDDTFYSHSKAETAINKSDIDEVFKSIYTAIISNIKTFLGKGSGSIVDSVIKRYITT